MNVVYTAAAQNDLREIGEWLAAHYPAIAPHVERRIRDAVAHIAQWPESAPRSAGREGVRVMPLGHYPYKIFYRVQTDAIEVLHVRHAARQPWTE
jgi:toxin ParE1/3/4